VLHSCWSRDNFAGAETMRITKTTLRLFIAAIALLVTMGGLSPRSFAQAISGDLVGTVTDSTGAVVPNAAVTATNVATGVKSAGKTNANGEYRFTNLPSGNYDIDVVSPNLK